MLLSRRGGRRRAALAMLVLVPGCSVASCEVEHAALPPMAEPTSSELGAWPEAVVPDLPPATPATRVTVRVDGVEVSNHELVGTWPAAALERARAEAPADAPDWPRLAETLAEPAVEGMRIPALHALLVRARRAERAATGAGTGAGVFNLRVESAVPIAEVERVLYTAAQVGYGAPRVLLQRGSSEQMLTWPAAQPRRAPSRAQIEAALHAPGALELTGSREPRIELTPAHVRVEETVLDGLVDPGALERAVADREGPVTLTVTPEVPFARVATVLQALAAREVRLRVVR